MARLDGTITIENARLVFCNFAGKEGKYNREGDRNFCVLLDESVALQMEEDGWNIKWLKAREEGTKDQPYINITCGYGGKGRPPRVNMITSKGRTPLTEDMVELLDWADIKTADLIFRPYTWAVGDKGGVKAYLQTLFVTIEEDELELKYADVNDVGDVPARAGRTDEGTPPW